jgi:hypothetical protein
VTRDEFASLPPRIALELIYDMAKAKLINVPRPDVPKPPLYDGRLSRGDKGFVWMSEMLLSDLEWWRTAKQKTVDEGGKWAEQAGKAVVTLSKWIAWRSLFPSELWSGKRNDDRVTAAPPNRTPAVHDWPKKNESQKKPGPSSSRGPAPDEPEDDLGF